MAVVDNAQARDKLCSAIDQVHVDKDSSIVHKRVSIKQLNTSNQIVSHTMYYAHAHST